MEFQTYIMESTINNVGDPTSTRYMVKLWYRWVQISPYKSLL